MSSMDYRLSIACKASSHESEDFLAGVQYKVTSVIKGHINNTS